MIEIKDLTKVYKSGKGVFDVSFEVKQGEVFGFLGPNGAGKTTTIRNLLGFLNPDQGSCRISNLDCWSNAAKIQEFVGYIPGEIAFIDNMTGISFLNLIAKMRKMQNFTRKNELIEILDFNPKGKIRNMSKGMKQKLGIITAFMHDPEVYILDEPTSGLDPLMQTIFVDIILEEKKRNKTILMSSHSFEEIERTCDRAGIIKEGRIATIQDIHSLKASQRKVFSINVSSQKDLDNIKASTLEVVSIKDNFIEIAISGNYEEFFKVLSKCNVISLDAAAQNIEQIFMQYYGTEGGKNHE
jgi:ABC-2 type transport system ATP-binding protein